MRFGISKTYPDSIDSLFHVGPHNATVCTNAKLTAQTILTLPCHPLIKEKDIFRIVDVIRSVMDK
jgi:dTDP-4-amino-4,6-dideoxygalactose transaminase